MVIRDASELEKIDLDSLSYVNAGYYGSVYKYGDKALKVFHSKDYIDMLGVYNIFEPLLRRVYMIYNIRKECDDNEQKIF